MNVIIGMFVVTACVLGGFMMSGGHVGALIHPSELVTIGGASLGALIVMCSKKVMLDLVHGIKHALKGSHFNKDMYFELFRLMYDILRTARRSGLLGLASHLEDPENSEIFKRYPKISHDKDVLGFLIRGLMPFVEGVATPDQIPALLETELKAREEEHHAPIAALSRTADGLPGFGIVAAVLGIVITMGAIDGPVEEIGHKVGAALVGTFLGILMSYGFFAPLAARMEAIGHEELAFYRTISAIVLAFVKDLPPKVAVELGTRGVTSNVRPERAELDKIFQEVDAAA